METIEATRSRLALWLMIAILVGALIVGERSSAHHTRIHQPTEPSTYHIDRLDRVIARLEEITKSLPEKSPFVNQTVTVNDQEVHPALLHLSHFLDKRDNEREAVKGLPESHRAQSGTNETTPQSSTTDG